MEGGQRRRSRSGRQRSRGTGEKMGNFVGFFFGNMINEDMRKAHYAHGDDKKCFWLF